MGDTSRRQGRTAGALLVATVVALTTALPATAAEQPGAVDVALADPAALDSLADVAALAAATRDEPGVRVGVVEDRNGDLPGGQAATQVVVPADEARRVVARLDEVPGVESAAVDRPVRAFGTDPLAPVQLSRTRTGAAALPDALDGRGTVVAVVDTGVDASHPDLSPTLADGSPRVLPGTSFLPGTELDGVPGTTDPSGHGTHVAGVVAAARNGVGTVGLAPGAQILPVRVIAPDGTGWSSAVAAAVRWSHDQGADVINLSLGSTGPLPQLLSDAVDYATSDTRGGRRPSVVVAAAGNSGTSGAPVWPAVLPRVVAVGATDAVDRVTSFSTRGSWIDVAAPGVDVLSTCAGGAWCALSGTSTAAPAVAATAALLRQQDPGRSPAAVQYQLESSAKDLGLPGKDVEYGAGLVRPAAALGLADVGAVPAPAPPGAPADVQTSCLPTACLVTFRTVGESVWGTFVAARTGPAGPPAALAGGPSSPVVLAGLAPGTGYALVLTSGGPGGIGASTAVLVRTPGLPSTAGRSKVARRGRTARRAAVRRR